MNLENTFYILEKDWYKLQGWATIAYDKDKNEISGLMTAIPQEDGRIKIGDVEILKQENSAANTELDGDAVSAYMMKHGMKHNNPAMKFVWWHSHHTMEAFWSGTDEKEIGAWKNNSYSLALVINLKEEYLFRISFWKSNGLDVEHHEDINLTIERKNPLINISNTMKKQYEELCSNSHTNTYTRQGYTNSYSHHNNSVITRNPNQYNLWYNNQKNESELSVEKSYLEALSKAEELQDSFMDGTLSFTEWNKEVKKVNKTCKKHKLPFRLIVWKLNKHQLTNMLMTKLPAELFDWDDNLQKERAETIAWNDSFGGMI
jgi:hypothetical protein